MKCDFYRCSKVFLHVNGGLHLSYVAGRSWICNRLLLRSSVGVSIKFLFDEYALLFIVILMYLDGTFATCYIIVVGWILTNFDYDDLTISLLLSICLLSV
jgi:hypothetical protein